MAGREYADTGYGPIDTEHRAISQQLQALVNAVRADDTAAVKAQLTVLHSSVADHFAHEERLMVAHGFPKLVPHKQTHDLFLADVAAKAKLLGSKGLTDDLRRWAVGRCLEWFRFHIMANDVELGRFLVARGVAPAA